MLPFAQIPEAVAITATAANDTGIDVGALAKGANGNPVMLLAMAAVALLGGKKVWEVLKQRQEQAHEAKMAQIEAGKSVHAECQAKQTALQEQVAAMARVVQSLEDRAKAAEGRAAEVVQKAEARVGELEAKVGQVQQQVAAAEAKAKKAEKAAKAKAKADAKPAG
jgi:hypothetical protein